MNLLPKVVFVIRAIHVFPHALLNLALQLLDLQLLGQQLQQHLQAIIHARALQTRLTVRQVLQHARPSRVAEASRILLALQR